MLNIPLSRRKVARLVIVGMATSLAWDVAVAQSPPKTVRATAILFESAFPHPGLQPDFYLAVADRYLAEIKGKPAEDAHVRGLAALDGSHIAPFADLPAIVRQGLIKRLDQEPFFKALTWRGAELIYRDPVLWKLIGYEGSSIEYGGYKERGFDDIDWLPVKGGRA